jgi:transposase
VAKGRPKGGTNKYWTTEEKYKIIKPIIEFEKSSSQVTKETGISNGMLSVWVKKYNENGLKGLKNKKKPGNPMSSLMNRKKLSDMEKLELENMKLRIENERLKKGYQVKGDGSVVVFKK